MFPPERLDADTVAPLTPDDFVRRVLVPEVAVALIEEDLGVSRTAAIRTLRDSAQYGVAIFPDDANAGARGAQAAAAGASEADRMMHERATARRRELEAEEAAERAGIAATESDADDDGEVDLSFVAPRARPIAPRARKREALELSGASAGEASPPRPKRRKTPTPAASENEAPAGDVMDIDTDSDAGARRTTARSRFRKPLSQSTAENSPVRPQGRAAKPGKVKERSRGASEDEERNLMPSRLKRRVEDSDSDLEIVPSIVKRDKGKARSQDVLDIESTPQPEKKEKTRAVDRAIFGTAPDDKPLLAARRKKRFVERASQLYQYTEAAAENHRATAGRTPCSTTNSLTRTAPARLCRTQIDVRERLRTPALIMLGCSRTRTANCRKRRKYSCFSSNVGNVHASKLHGNAGTKLSCPCEEFTPEEAMRSAQLCPCPCQASVPWRPQPPGRGSVVAFRGGTPCRGRAGSIADTL
jgi:hypothetical protein